MNKSINIELYYMTQNQLQKHITKEIKKHYTNIIITENGYIYAQGTIPILLVSHLDTVFGDNKIAGIGKIKHNKIDNYIYTNKGLGADDRAGVNMILNAIKDLKNDQKPSILFCCDEEIGGGGAKLFISSKIDMSHINVIVELDRQGYNQFVTYSCNNPILDEYAKSFRLDKHVGTFSDISIICPSVGIGGINLSIGYDLQHTKDERLYIDDFIYMYNVIIDILHNPPTEKIEYITEKWEYNGYNYSKYNYDMTYSKYNYSTAYDDEITINIDIDDIHSYNIINENLTDDEILDIYYDKYDEIRENTLQFISNLVMRDKIKGNKKLYTY